MITQILCNQEDPQQQQQQDEEPQQALQTLPAVPQWRVKL